MADAVPNRYEKLPGTGHRRLVPGWAIVALFFVIGIFALLLRGRRTRLWLGTEHLLMVDFDGAREYYKRFNYADIQCILIQRTAEWKIVNIVLGIATVFFLIIVFMSDSAGIMTMWGIVAGMFALLLASNALAGPTCKCQLRTAVQTEELISLNRIKNANKALVRIRPLIEAAQGPLTPEEIAAQFQQTSGMPSATASTTFATPTDSPEAPPFING